MHVHNRLRSYLLPPSVLCRQSPVARVPSRVARRDCLGPGTGPELRVLSPGLHRQGPRAHDVRLPEVVGGGVEGLGGCPRRRWRVLSGLEGRRRV